MSTELSISHREGMPPVGLAMTGAAFDAAQRDSVIRIEPDIAAMAQIAQEIGALHDARAFSPLLIVARDGSPQRAMIGGWDSRLPVDASSPSTGRYFPATELEHESPRTCNRHTLVQFAKRVGASMLTEITVSGWHEEARRQHAAAFATGLLLGQRPLDLEPRAGLGRRAWSAVKGSFGDEARSVKAINRVKALGDALPQPFIVTYGQLALPAGESPDALDPTSGRPLPSENSREIEGEFETDEPKDEPK